MTSAHKSVKNVLALSTAAVLSASTIALMAPAANAATADFGGLAYSGPARNGGTPGAVVVLKVKPGTVDPAQLFVTSTALGATGSEDNATQTVSDPTLEATIANGAPGDSAPTDGLDELVLRVPVTTTADGATANYAIFEDEDVDGAVDATEPRVQVSTTTAGAPTNVSIAPATQTAPQGVESGDYTVTIRDAAGRVTQLDGGETIDITDNVATTTTSDTQITAGEAPRGTATFTATGTAKGLTTISAFGANGANTNTATANLDVVGAATISDDELDIVTSADSWDGFGDGDNPVSVRVDQTSIRLDFKSNDLAADANGIVQLELTGVGGVKFGGQTTTTVTTTLNSQGIGSITITPDAGSVNDGGSIDIVGSGINNTLEFDRAQIDDVVAASSTYVSKFGGSVDVVVTVLDQFGLPFASGQLDAQRQGGVNADAAPTQRKNIGADGKVTFTFTDTKATELSKASDAVNVGYYTDQFDASRDNYGTVATIVYTADGLGADFTVTADGVNTAGAAYDPASVDINPLADAIPDAANEFVDLTISGGTGGTPATVTADNGGLILNRTDGDATLADAAASKTGALTDDFIVVGTKTGLVNVTVTSAGRTKTFAITVEAPVGPARNIALTGPAEGTAGQLAVFTATITDAFGNPVANLDTLFGVNVQVSGPGELQDNSRITDANGQLKLNVRLDDDASSPVTVNITAANFGEFGATANDNDLVDDNDNPGLTASVNTASATISDVVDIEALQAAVDAAQAQVEIAQGALNVAKAQLNTAQVSLNNKIAFLKAERRDVAVLQKKINKLKAQIKEARANGNKFRAAKLTRQLKFNQRKIAIERRQVVKAVGAVKVARANVAAKQLNVTNAQAKLEAAQAELARAQAELDEAQN